MPMPTTRRRSAVTVVLLTMSLVAGGYGAAPQIPAQLDSTGAPLPAGAVPKEVMVRARVTDVKPKAFARILYCANPIAEFTRYKFQADPPKITMGKDNDFDLDALLDEKPEAERDVIALPDKAYTILWLKPGVWSPAVPISLLGEFQTFIVHGMWPKPVKPGNPAPPIHAPVQITNLTVEFELSFAGKPIKTISDYAENGDRITIRFARHALGTADKPLAPGPDFLDNTHCLLEYVKRRADKMESLPWANGPLPKRYTFLSACSGWKTQTSNKDVYLNEYRTMRQLGCNGIFYDTWPGIEDAIRGKTGIASEFGKAKGRNQDLPGAKSQYLLAHFNPEQGADNPPGAGCPAHPANADHRAKVRAGVETLMARIRQEPYEEYWFQTISEIGCFYDNSAEGKSHQGCCPYCRKAFQDFVKSFGLSYADFGAKSWDDIRSTYGYFAKPFEQQFKEAEAKKAADAANLAKGAESDSSLHGAAPDSQVIDLSDEDAEAQEQKAESQAPAARDAPKIPLPDYGAALLSYYSARFINESSAKIFAPLREAFVEQNEKKRLALAAGKLDSTEARQPWVYTFALRGNSFLMGGHSLDFYDWYRHADNAFEYETSNRDPRVWEWDSYLCDVGRIHQEKLGTVFSIMIKPDRGAVVQRALTAVARKARAIYWYTYGPDWHHPDTFAKFYKFGILTNISRTVHMIGEAEDVIYEADWAAQAEVAVARADRLPDNNASWENGKWIYQALTHAHIPVDALDDGYLLSEDLARYKVIYMSGAGLRQDAAAKLAKWIEAGGVLVAGAGSLVFDETGRPLAALQQALGLKTRAKLELWGGVKRYGSTALPPITPDKAPPAGARIAGKAPYSSSFSLAVGREILDPEQGTETLATFADGGAAATRHAHGKGFAYMTGFYPGIEYASDVLRNDYDMSKDFQADKRGFVAAPALAAGVRPAVDASHPLIEGVLLKNPKTGKLAVILMNWAYKGREHVPLENIVVTIRGAGAAASARSLWHRESAACVRKDDVLAITLPRIEDGDILLLE